MSPRKIFAMLAWVVTAAFLIGVALPLLIERLVTDNQFGWTSKHFGFKLKDESGRRHLGFFASAHSFKDMTFFEYGYEAPKDKDLSPWHKQILGLGRGEVAEKEGFVWSDKGFLWGDNKAFGDNLFVDAGRQGLTKPVGLNDLSELTLPGAPWDIQGKELDYLGKFPNYRTKFEDKNFKLDLNLVASVPNWYMYNNGAPFRVGDFGMGAMTEMTGHVTGIITHKQTGETFKVAGEGLLEDAGGFPWSWIDWGMHDWTDYHFPGGWGGSLWKAHDDWQWGYHATPHLGWLWDPIQKKFLTFYRVDLVEVDYVKDSVTNLEYPKLAVWRAIGPDATLELHNTNLTFKPRESRFPIGPIDMTLGMSYGNNVSTATLIRRDGSVVALKDGIGTMEHYNPAIPDYVFWGPVSLLLLVLSWGAYRIAARREEKRSIVAPLIWSTAGLIAIAMLNLAWSA